MTTIGKRLHAVRKQLSLSQADFSEKIGISRSFISEVESDKGVPGGEMLLSVKRQFSIDIDWLLTGDGEMFRAKGQKAAESGTKAVSAEKVNPAPDSTLQAKVEQLEWVVEGFMKQQKFTGEVIGIPLTGEIVSAGAPAYQIDVQTSTDDRIYLNRSFIKHEFDTFAVKVWGDSMVDAGINQGDILVVDRRKEAKSGKIAVVGLDGGLVIKKIERRGNKIYLVSANAKYPEILIEEHMEARLIGVVLFILRPV